VGGFILTVSATWHGHKIYRAGECWFYSDNGDDVSDFPDRACGHCNKSPSPEGHDGCLGVLAGVRNACCGHGTESEAYVQFDDNTDMRGARAVKFFNQPIRR